MSSVFITGASGFLGRAIADRYRAAGVAVRGVDLVADPARDVVAGDVGTPGAWQDHAAGCDLVIHTAAVVSLQTSGLEAVYRANVLGTAHAHAAARDARRFLHLSTVVTFGFDFPDGVDESAPVAITGLPYGDTKVAAEQLLLQRHAQGDGAPVTIVRPGDVYGPRSRAWATLPYEMIRARRFALPAGGRGIFSPVYVDDLVDGIVAAASSDAAAGRVLTLSGGVGVPNREFFGAYAAHAGRRLITLPAPVMLAATRAVSRGEINAFSTRYLLRRGTYSIAGARELIGYAPRVTVEDGIERTLRWLTS